MKEFEAPLRTSAADPTPIAAVSSRVRLTRSVSAPSGRVATAPTAVDTAAN